MGKELNGRSELSHFFIRIDQQEPLSVLFNYVVTYVIENKTCRFFYVCIVGKKDI